MLLETALSAFPEAISALSALSSQLGDDADISKILLDLVIFEMRKMQHMRQAPTLATLIREAIGLVDTIGKRNVTPSGAMMPSSVREKKEKLSLLAADALEKLFKLARALIKEG